MHRPLGPTAATRRRRASHRPQVTRRSAAPVASSRPPLATERRPSASWQNPADAAAASAAAGDSPARGAGRDARREGGGGNPDATLVGNARALHAASAGRSATITVCGAIGNLLVGEEVCRLSGGRERLIPHARSSAGASSTLGDAVILASFWRLTVAPPRGAKAPYPRLGRAGLTAIAVAPPLAPAAQLESASATAAVSALELHPSGRARTRQRPRGCPSSRPRQCGSATRWAIRWYPGRPSHSPERVKPPSSQWASPVSGETHPVFLDTLL